MADFAKGLSQGYAIGERAYNAYQQADEQRRIKAIQNAQTEQSYSPDDLARLQGLYDQQQQVVQQYTAAPGMGAERGGAVYDEAGAQAELARRGLVVNPNVSPAGQVQGFNYGLSQRGMGADRGAPGMDQTIQAQQGITPRAAFLGQQYDPSALTPEKMNSLRYGAMADVIGGRDPAGALRMRNEITQNDLRMEEAQRQRQLFPGQLEDQTLGTAGKRESNAQALRINPTLVDNAGLTNAYTRNQIATQNNALDAAEIEKKRKAENAAWWKKQLTNEDGSVRAVKPSDYLAASQRAAQSFFQTGDYEKGGLAYDEFLQRAETQVVRQEKERKRAGELAFAAVKNGDYQAGIDFYNKFLPNGSNATSVVPGKDGSLVVSHKDLSGNKLPDTKITKQELLEGISSFGDSAKALSYVQQSFANNLNTRQANQQDTSLGLQARSVVVNERNADLNEEKASFNKFQTLREFEVEQDKNRVAKPTKATGLIKAQDSSTGDLVLVDPSSLVKRPDGTLTLPKGLVPLNARTEPTDAAVVKEATLIMEDRKNYPMVDGKRVKPTREEAIKRAKDNLRRRQSTEPQEDSTDRLIRLMQAAKSGSTVDSEAD